MTNIIKKLCISISAEDMVVLGKAETILKDIAEEIEAAQDNDEEVVIEAILKSYIKGIGAAFDNIPNVDGNDEDEEWEVDGDE